jgi:histidine triad (HIT) family protein
VSSACAFDPIIAGTAPAHLVLEEPEVVAFLDARPVFPGHTLVVPRRHYETVSELPVGMAGLIWDAGARVAAAQRTALGAAGTFFGLNDVVSQSVPHVHLHVVPRRPKDGLRGFFWPRQRYAGDDHAAATARAIRDALEATPAAAPDPIPEVSVRPARAADATAVAEILAGGSIRAGEDPADPEPYRRAIEEVVADPPGTVLVAETGGQVAGVCQLLVFRHLQERGGLCAEIESMHVAEDQRGRGFGTALLNAAVERARAAGCYRIQLTSNKLRPDAHRFYRRHGFEASHEGFKLYLQAPPPGHAGGPDPAAAPPSGRAGRHPR